jgi:hypothetical protein
VVKASRDATKRRLYANEATMLQYQCSSQLEDVVAKV